MAAIRRLCSAAVAAALTACGGATGGAPAGGPAATLGRSPKTSSPIKHVVIIVQENRTVDDLFNGLPGADTAQSGQNSHGQTVELQPESLVAPYDLSHAHSAFKTEYAGGNLNGFDLEQMACNKKTPPSECPPTTVAAYGYVPKAEVQPYWDMAQQYAFADDTFETDQGPSFPAHQYLVSGSATIDYGSTLQASEEPLTAAGKFTGGCDSPQGSIVQVIDVRGNENRTVYPCFNRISLMQLADEYSIGWRYYQARPKDGAWHAPDAIRSIRYGRSYANVISPSERVLADVAHGSLAKITWVTPDAAESDHAGTNDGSGPSWVASVVNEIGESKYWSSTAIFLLWDDWGGWYDHVRPPMYDSFELGFRVPLIVISPYAKAGYVSHSQHEFGSILKFTEETFGLPSLGTTDVRSDDLADCFDFGSKPRRFRHIRARYSARYFLTRPVSTQSPDDD